ncbi:MAG: pantetheine-phosphate adenylyltransferase, partial [Deltaproteobacteria bacterium]|nr:pantetheine-phosphate adenylyltransferase [Deltaproteobacteria bacterium]
MPALAVYPGTFDPPTLGHLGLIGRILEIFDELIILIAENPRKKPLFTVGERTEMLEKSLSPALLNQRIFIDSYQGLLVEYARLKGAQAIVRGLRGSSDFDYEFQLAMMNRHLDQEIQSVFFMADYQWFFISSSAV